MVFSNFPNGKLSALIIFEKFVSRETSGGGILGPGSECTYTYITIGRHLAARLQQTDRRNIYIKIKGILCSSALFSREPGHHFARSHAHTHTNTHTHNVSEVYQTVHDLLPVSKTCAQSGHAMSIYCSLFKWRALVAVQARGWIFLFFALSLSVQLFLLLFLSLLGKKKSPSSNRNLSQPKSFLSGVKKSLR